MRAKRAILISIAVALFVTIGFLLIMSNISNNHLFPYYNPFDGFTCMVKGGNYFIGGEYVVCQIPVSDEGMQCTDMSQCEDICKAETEDDTTGVCTVFSHGCDLVLNEGHTNWLCS